MWAASDIADWWDEQHRQAKTELDLFVDNNPNLFGVIVATSVATAMEVGAGTADMLRFGQGLAEGGVRGVGKDALRLIGLAGPLGRGAKLVQAAANARLARLIVDPGGGICGWLSGAQALRQTGTKAFVAVDDLAQALGKNLAELGGIAAGQPYRTVQTGRRAYFPAQDGFILRRDCQDDAQRRWRHDVQPLRQTLAGGAS